MTDEVFVTDRKVVGNLENVPIGKMERSCFWVLVKTYQCLMGYLRTMETDGYNELQVT